LAFSLIVLPYPGCAKITIFAQKYLADFLTLQRM